MNTKNTELVIYYRDREPVFKSWLKDSVTFSWLGLCIYLSNGSTWWTLFTGGLTILFFWGMMVRAYKEGRMEFHTKDEVRAWLETLP